MEVVSVTDKLVNILEYAIQGTASPVSRAEGISILSSVNNEVLRDAFVRTWSESHSSFCTERNLPVPQFQAWIRKPSEDPLKYSNAVKKYFNQLLSEPTYVPQLSSYKDYLRTVSPTKVVFADFDFDGHVDILNLVGSLTGVVAVGVSSGHHSKVQPLNSYICHSANKEYKDALMIMMKLMASQILPLTSKFYFILGEGRSYYDLVSLELTSLESKRSIEIVTKQEILSILKVSTSEQKKTSPREVPVKVSAKGSAASQTLPQEHRFEVNEQPQKKIFQRPPYKPREDLEEAERILWSFDETSLNPKVDRQLLEGLDKTPVYATSKFYAAKRWFTSLCITIKTSGKVTQDFSYEFTFSVTNTQTNETFWFKGLKNAGRGGVTKYFVLERKEDGTYPDFQDFIYKKKKASKKYEPYDVTEEEFRELVTYVNDNYLCSEEGEIGILHYSELGSIIKKEEFNGHYSDYTSQFIKQGLAKEAGRGGDLRLEIFKSQVYKFLYGDE